MNTEYEAVNFIIQWAEWLLLLIATGAGLRVAYLAFQKTTTSDGADIETYNKRIRHTIIGAIIAVTMGSTIAVLRTFYL